MNFEQKLIEEVQEYQILYNINHKQYRNTKKKDKAWEEIGRHLNRNDETCRKRWKSLRDTYRKHKRTAHLLKPTVGFPRKQWTYLENMKFLDNFADKIPLPGADDEQSVDNITDDTDHSLTHPLQSASEVWLQQDDSTSTYLADEQQNEEVTTSFTQFSQAESSTQKFYDYIATRLVNSKLTDQQRGAVDSKVLELVNALINKYEAQNSNT